jgi:hypothetical protein
MLREAGEATPLSPELEEHLRRVLLERMAARPRARNRWEVRAALALVLAAVVTVAGLLAEDGGEPSVAARAYAAIAPGTGIMHFVVENVPVERNPTPRVPVPTVYREYWIDVAHPMKQRVVTTIGGRVADQYVYVNHRVRAPGGVITWSRHPRTYIQRGYPGPTDRWPAEQRIEFGLKPVEAYRELLKHGVVESQSEISYAGHDAYELKILYKPPYQFVDDIWTGDRQTYIVDRHTYYPLESTFQLDPSFGGSSSTVRYPVFETLPATAENSKLLEPVRNPRPYRP